MARCRSRRRPRWTVTIPPPPASRSRACSRRRARRDCSRDELGPDPPHAPAAALLPGVYQTSGDELVKDAERAHRLGLGGIMLFGLPAAKDATGSEAYDEQGVVQQAVRAVKRAVPELLVIGDVCLCEYTDHGHCGVIQDGDVDNDASVYLLGKVAVT